MDHSRNEEEERGIAKNNSEVKKAIKFLKSHFAVGIYTKKSNEIINLLKRGEKYEAIVNDLKKFNDGKVLKVNENEWWKYRVNKIIQKYFPKEN